MSMERERNIRTQPGTALAPSERQLLPRLLTLPEVAELLAVSERTVRRLGIPHFKVGRQVRYDRGSVNRWLEARKEQ